MHNLYTNFVRILEICKLFTEDLVNDKRNYQGLLNNRFTRLDGTSIEKQHSQAVPRPDFT